MKFYLMTSMLVGALLMSATVGAKPLFKTQYAAYYKVPAVKCTTCHTASPKLNAYGAALKVALKGKKSLTPAMFKATDVKAPKS